MTWRDTAAARRFYRSSAWRKARSVALARSDGLCERCIEQGRVELADVVHHKVPLDEEKVKDPQIALNPDMLMALCDECHTEVHKQLGIGALNGRVEEEPRVGFDEEGNVIPI